LGVDYLLATEVSEVGGVWLLSMSLIEVAKAQPVNRVGKKVQQLADLVNSAQDAVHEVFAPFMTNPEPGPTPAAVKPDPENKDAPKPAKVTAAVEAGPGGSTRRTAGIALDVAGGALIVGGAVCGVLALVKYNQGKTAVAADLPGIKSTGKAEAWTANVLYGAGAAALVIGLVLTFTGSSSSTAPGQAGPVSAALVPGGGAVVFSGSFR